MKILGIETSCDETAAAIVEDGTKILSNVVASSLEMHAKTGGIIPEQAARQQIRSIVPVISESLSQAFSFSQTTLRLGNSQDLETSYNLLASNVDAIAVTIGPGLIGSLLVGVETAKTLSLVSKKPIVPVNHLVGHIYANWLTQNSKPKTHKLPQFPALALVVSGGHTDLVLMRKHGSLKWIGGTRDDAAGEAFDKCARLLGLPYPGGPSISEEAEKYFRQKPKKKRQKLNLFPRPLADKENFDWSFSGLKTAVLRQVKGERLEPKERQRVASEIQEAIVDCLVEKSIRAIKFYKPKSFLLAGGVAANARLREKFLNHTKSERLEITLHVPPPKLCTDNAAYIAACAYYNYRPILWKKISAKPELTIVGEA